MVISISRNCSTENSDDVWSRITVLRTKRRHEIRTLAQSTKERQYSTGVQSLLGEFPCLEEWYNLLIWFLCCFLCLIVVLWCREHGFGWTCLTLFVSLCLWNWPQPWHRQALTIAQLWPWRYSLSSASLESRAKVICILFHLDLIVTDASLIAWSIKVARLLL
jgi:hypothetical protein